jgi:hypothetical protein
MHVNGDRGHANATGGWKPPARTALGALRSVDFLWFLWRFQGQLGLQAPARAPATANATASQERLARWNYGRPAAAARAAFMTRCSGACGTRRA